MRDFIVPCAQQLTGSHTAVRLSLIVDRDLNCLSLLISKRLSVFSCSSPPPLHPHSHFRSPHGTWHFQFVELVIVYKTTDYKNRWDMKQTTNVYKTTDYKNLWDMEQTTDVYKTTDYKNRCHTEQTNCCVQDDWLQESVWHETDHSMFTTDYKNRWDMEQTTSSF